jgi:hypothetical protein
VGDFPVEMHIISALWINTIGQKFDACLRGKNIYGSRLRRVGEDSDTEEYKPRRFHISAIGSFQPYMKPYSKWRQDGLDVIRAEIKKGKVVIAASLDLKSYYHLLNPDFISNSNFQNEIGVVIKEEESDFTRQISELLCQWSSGAQDFAQNSLGSVKINGGLVIGLAASKIISNVALHRWDKLISEKIKPVHYGRYVDDMLLVMHQPEKTNIYDSSSFMEFLSDKFGNNDCDKKFLSKESKGDNKEIWEIKLGKSHNNSTIELQTTKQKLFILDGQAGLDLIDNISKEIIELSSERRLMPESFQLESNPTIKALTASDCVGEEADTLRKADGLTIRRLGWALQMRQVQTLANDLPKDNWREYREKFYDLSYNHLLKADKIFDYYTQLPRLLGFAINIGDWRQSIKIIRKSYEAIEELSKESSKIKVNGIELPDNKKIWEFLNDSLTLLFADVIACNYSINTTKNPLRIKSKINHHLFRELLEIDLPKKALLIFSSDLARNPYKKFNIFAHKILTTHYAKQQLLIHQIFKETKLIIIEDLDKFLNNTINKRFGKIYDNEPLLPFLFPTRPLTPSEIAEYEPDCITTKQGNNPLQLWAKYVQAIRGVWVYPQSLKPENLEIGNEFPRAVIKIGKESKKLEKVCVAITNFVTEDSSYKNSISGNPDLKLINRYAKLARLVNHIIKLDTKPNYLVLPELSLPLKWLDSFSNRLQDAGVNLIVGTEYKCSDVDVVKNQVCLVLIDDRLGCYPTSVRIWQSKSKPAKEEKIHLKNNNKSFAGNTEEKPIYIHNGFHFGVLICSELLNSKERISFQGQVDAMIIPAWNKDIKTFSYLVEASSLDIHSYIILVNNGLYGDSRVRAPAKEDYKRDIAQLRGGNDFGVLVNLDVKELRKFQMGEKFFKKNSNGDQEEYQPFKDIPDGFEMLITRQSYDDGDDSIKNPTDTTELPDDGKDIKNKPKYEYILEIPIDQIKEKFKEAIWNHYGNDPAMHNLDDAVDTAFSNLKNKVQFGIKKKCEIIWYGEFGWVYNYKISKGFSWGKRSIKNNGNYKFKRVPLEYLKEQERLVEIEIEKAKIEKDLSQEKAAKKAEYLFTKYSKIKPRETYLGGKGITDLNEINVRYNKGATVLPLMDMNDKIWSLQFIKKNSKGFLKGGKKRGNFFILQNKNISNGISDENKVYLAEGFATAATIHKALQRDVVVCFDAHNIEPVLENLIQKFPTKEYIVASDNDLWKERNTGKEVADQILQKYPNNPNIKIRLPQFSEEHKDSKPSDFNDLYNLMGMDEVLRQIN